MGLFVGMVVFSVFVVLCISVFVFVVGVSVGCLLVGVALLFGFVCFIVVLFGFGFCCLFGWWVGFLLLLVVGFVCLVGLGIGCLSRYYIEAFGDFGWVDLLGGLKVVCLVCLDLFLLMDIVCLCEVDAFVSFYDLYIITVYVVWLFVCDLFGVLFVVYFVALLLIIIGCLRGVLVVGWVYSLRLIGLGWFVVVLGCWLCYFGLCIWVC